MPERLQDDAVLGGVLTGALTVVGWPLKACRDALRATQLFRRVALADFLGYFTMAGLSIALAVAGGAAVAADRGGRGGAAVHRRWRRR